MSVPTIDYIDAMPAADLRTNLRNAYATTSALNREIEMLHRMIRRQKAQRDALLAACTSAQIILATGTYAVSGIRAETIAQLEAAIATAKGGADVEVLK